MVLADLRARIRLCLQCDRLRGVVSLVGRCSPGFANGKWKSRLEKCLPQAALDVAFVGWATEQRVVESAKRQIEVTENKRTVYRKLAYSAGTKEPHCDDGEKPDLTQICRALAGHAGYSLDCT